VIALATTLVGCSHQPPQQAATEPCTDKHWFACPPRPATYQPIELASLRTNPPRETKLKNEKPSPPPVRDKAARFITKKAKPASIRAKTEPTATRIPLPSPSFRTQLEPKSKATAADSGTIGRATVDLSSDSKSGTMREQVAAATGVAERMTVATLAAAHDNVEPNKGEAPNKTDLLVAVVMARPEIKSVTDLAGKSVALDERYSASSVDVRIGFVVAGAVSVEVSAAHTAAIDRLNNGEVTAAVLTLVSADAADGFPEISGFRIFRVPLWPPALKPRP
jgi:hypothetical protein